MKSIGLYDNGFLKIKEGVDVIKESVRRILLTSPGEYVGNLNFGSDLKRLLFNSESILNEDIEIAIRNAIRKYEPRVTVIQLDVNKKEDFVASVELILQIKEDLSTFTLEMEVGV